MRIKFRVFNFGSTYMAMASNGRFAVCNCYGSTPEHAKEMALWRLRNAKNAPTTKVRA